MINKKYLILLRSKDRKYGENFIYNEISKNIIDSLDILKVPFNNILQLGINDNLIISYLKEKFPSCSITSADIDLSSGEILYIDNRAAISRSAAQQEDFKIIIQL